MPGKDVEIVPMLEFWLDMESEERPKKTNQMKTMSRIIDVIDYNINPIFVILTDGIS